MEKKKPTIEELEEILAGPPCNIRINPDGSLDVAKGGDKTEERLPKEPPLKGYDVRVKVEYKAPEGIITDMDNAVLRAMEKLNADWYAQGLDKITGIRDICFDLKI